MTIAEIHGKLSSSGSKMHERLEDLLTSDVFSTFRYLTPDLGLLPFLRLVARENPESRLGEALRSLEEATQGSPTVQYEFWPKGTLRNREPDVLIILGKGVHQVVVNVEAKYEAPPSDYDIEGEGEGNKSEVDELDKRTGLQLANQFEDLMQEGEAQYKGLPALTAPPKRRFLLYLTSHFIAPEDVLEKNTKAMATESRLPDCFKNHLDVVRQHVVWAGWTTAWHACMNSLEKLRSLNPDEDTPEIRILEDAIELLKRKDFVGFMGFRPPRIPEVDFGFWELFGYVHVPAPSQGHLSFWQCEAND